VEYITGVIILESNTCPSIITASISFIVGKTLEEFYEKNKDSGRE
jgi:hypothetical protein